jgi:hypothetical protein
MNDQTIDLMPAQEEDTTSKATRRSRRVVPLSFQMAGIGLNLISRLNNAWVAEVLGNLWFTVFKKAPKSWVKELWQQAEQRFELDLGDKSIPVYLWGRGPLIVMMHGWSGSGTQYRRFIPTLVNAGYQVALFDAPAHGSNPGKRSDLVQFCDALISIQQQIGPVDTVIAHSLGAMASVLATQRGLGINRMVLLAPHLDVSEMFESYRVLLNINNNLAGCFHQNVGKKMAKVIGHQDPWKMLSPTSLLKEETVPGLLVFDSDDEEIPQRLFFEIEQQWKKAKVIKTQGLGHNGLLKDEVVIRQIMEYLAVTGW